MSADVTARTAWQALVDSPTRPARLAASRILFHEDLPADATVSEDLPALGVYLVEDIPLETAEGLSNRSATLHLDIRSLIADGQDALSATLDLRLWALDVLLPNQDRDSGFVGAEYVAFKPFSLAASRHLAGALLEITVPHFFDPLEP
jgi:hypothetical protein